MKSKWLAGVWALLGAPAAIGVIGYLEIALYKSFPRSLVFLVIGLLPGVCIGLGVLALLSLVKSSSRHEYQFGGELKQERRTCGPFMHNASISGQLIKSGLVHRPLSAAAKRTLRPRGAQKGSGTSGRNTVLTKYIRDVWIHHRGCSDIRFA